MTERSLAEEETLLGFVTKAHVEAFVAARLYLRDEPYVGLRPPVDFHAWSQIRDGVFVPWHYSGGHKECPKCQPGLLEYSA